MSRNSERGNVVFYIFLAIALFGALSIAVSKSGRESASAVSGEQDRLRATEIIDFGDTVAKAVGTIRLRGTSLSTLRFSEASLSTADYGAVTPANATNEVFNIDGGGVNYHKANTDAVTTGSEDFKFLSGNEIHQVGTTCAAANCSEILLVLPNVKPSVCTAIDTLSGVALTAGIPPVDSQIDLTHPFQGTMSYAQTIGDEGGSSALAGQMYGCFKSSSTDAYYFYRVLWQQ